MVIIAEDIKQHEGGGQKNQVQSYENLMKKVGFYE